MGKKKTIDAGLKYLMEIGFDRIRGTYGLANRLKTKFGDAKAEQLWNEWERLPTGSKAFYEFKNSDPELSKTFSEAYDGDILRKSCNYIDSHKEFFGETILEVGCESGYMTGFLAKTFPDAKIVSIDRSQSAINLAQAKIASMGLNNVEFRVASLGEISEQFDTVFCMRTIQENINSEKFPFMGEPLRWQFFQYGEVTEQYTQQLLSCLKEQGNLCIFERIDHDPLMCGWMMSLCLAECAPDINTYEEIKCEEAGEYTTFQAFVCHNQTEGDPREMIKLWSEAIENDVSSETVLTGWNALAYLDANAGKLIRGVRIFNRDNQQVGRFAIFFDKDDQSLIYYLYAAGGAEIQMYGSDSSEKENFINHLQKTIDQNKKAGYHAEDINPEEDFLEGSKSH